MNGSDSLTQRKGGPSVEPVAVSERAPEPRDKVVLQYDGQGRPTNFRVPGSVAGTWPHTPWYHCVLHDPYERVNVWSHGIPGAAFLLLGLYVAISGVLQWKGIALFSFCAAATQGFSALTHVYPDDHYLEKLDHIGIVALVVGTPMSTVMVLHPESSFVVMYAILAAMLCCAFLRPLPRVLAFGGGVAFLIGSHLQELNNAHLYVELVSYLVGALAFLRNKGHDRWPGLADHHFLHYCTTFSTIVHLHHLWGACNGLPPGQ